MFIHRIVSVYNEIPKDIIEAFTKLANGQRGEPEHSMLKFQRTFGGGVMSVVVEHVGDLTHRMSEHVEHGWGQDSVLEKTRRALRYLQDGYGFKKEHEENLRNNASYKGIPLKDFSKTIDSLLKNYADAHSKLEVYNRPQWLARQAAVYVGGQQFSKAETTLNELLKIAELPKDEYLREATKVHRDATGKIIPWRG